MKEQGFSLLEILFVLSLVGLLVLILSGVSGINFFRYLIPGSAPSTQYVRIAEQLSYRICQVKSPMPLEKCFDFSPDGCLAQAQSISLSCLSDMGHGAPPILEPNEEKYLEKTSATCITKKFSELLSGLKKTGACDLKSTF